MEIGSDFLPFYICLKNFSNPGGFDYIKYLSYRDIYVTAFLNDDRSIIRMAEGEANNFLLLVENCRDKIREAIEEHLSSPTRDILKALILGEKGTISPQIKEQFSTLGIAHVLASLIGPGIGGFFFTWFGIAGPGLFAAGLTLITITVTFIMLEETWPKDLRTQYHERRVIVTEKVRRNKNALFMLALWGFHTISFALVMTSLSFFSVSVLNLTPIEVSIVFMISGIFRAGIRFTGRGVLVYGQ